MAIVYMAYIVIGYFMPSAIFNLYTSCVQRGHYPIINFAQAKCFALIIIRSG